VSVAHAGPPPPVSAEKGLGVYHDYAGLSDELERFAGLYPGVLRLHTLGRSELGREIWAVVISDNPDIQEDEPEFKYVSTMHGDEPVGTELCLYFIDMLASSYGQDARLTDLVDSTEIWVVPLMNPDGLERGSRSNVNGFDLNRSFPNFGDHYENTLFDGEPLGAEGRPAEVRRIMEWTVDNSFVLSANIHTGALVVNYPYDHEPGTRSGLEAPSPDDSLFRELSLIYSRHNQPMFESRFFIDGITNGSDWFAVRGGMQDWNYRYAGCMEVTLELSRTKRPDETELPGLWADNAESMVSYIEAMHRGVRGVVTDRDTGEPVWAKVLVDDNPQPVFTDADVGDYHRILLPGEYDVRVEAPGYVTWSAAGVQVAGKTATRLDVALADPDVTNDGNLDARDVSAVLNHLLREPCPFDCDLDGGGLSSTDLQAVVNAVLDPGN